MTGDIPGRDRRAVADRYLSAWRLRPDGTGRNEDGALVLPVRTRAGEPAVLRFSRPGNDHEHLALRLWGGRGAVRLLRAEPADRALLLERAGDQDLRGLPDLESCRVLGELVRVMARPPRPPFPRLSEAASRWQADLEQDTAMDSRFPRRFRLQAVKSLARLRRDDLDLALVHGELHRGAVRGAVRGARSTPWLATGAVPVLGTAEFTLVPGLQQDAAETAHGGSLAAALADRVEALALAADADPERLRAWAVVRWTIEARQQCRRPAGAPATEAGTSRLVQLCKAVQRGA